MGNAHAVRASAHEFPQVGLMMSSTFVADSNATRPDTNHGYGRISAIPSTVRI